MPLHWKAACKRLQAAFLCARGRCHAYVWFWVVRPDRVMDVLAEPYRIKLLQAQWYKLIRDAASGMRLAIALGLSLRNCRLPGFTGRIIWNWAGAIICRCSSGFASPYWIGCRAHWRCDSRYGWWNWKSVQNRGCVCAANSWHCL